MKKVCKSIQQRAKPKPKLKPFKFKKMFKH